MASKEKKESSMVDLSYLNFGEEKEPPQQHNLYNTLKNTFKGIANEGMLSEKQLELGDLWDRYNNDPNLSLDEQKQIEQEYYKKYKEYDALANENKKYRDYLKEDDSTLGGIARHSLSAGTSLAGMAKQYGSALAGMGIGSVFGAPSYGWEGGNVYGSIWSNVDDARSGADEARREVFEKTGDRKLAQQAYNEALNENLGYSSYDIALDIITGGKLGGAILDGAVGKVIPKALKESKLVRGGSNLLGKTKNGIASAMERARATRLAKAMSNIDIGDESLGAWVAGRTKNTALGKGARWLGQVGMQDVSEMFQEGQQGVSGDAAVARALHQYDPEKYTDTGEHSFGRIKDWLNSEEGRETLLDTFVATTLTGGAGAGISSFNRLRSGYNYSSNLRQADNIVNDIQRGAINIDNEAYSGIKNAIGAANGLDDAQTSALSDQDVIRQVLEDNTDRAISMGMNEKDANAFAVNETIKLLNGEVATTANIGYTTATTEAFAKQHGLDISNLTNMEKRRQQEQEARQKALTQAKEAHEGTITDDTTPYSEKDKEAGTGKPIEVEQEQQKTTGQNSSSSLSNLFSNGFGQHWRVKQNAVDANGNEYSDDIAILENSKTGRVVQVQKLDNGKISVLDVTPEGATDENGKPVEASTRKAGRLSDKIGNKRVYFGTDANGIAALTKYMVSQENQTKTLKQEEDQANNEVKIADPNRRRVLVNSVHDLSNFYRNNKDLMDRDTFMMTARAMLAFGNGNVSIDLDLENQQAGKRGETTLPDVQNGVSKAIISLYSGADAMTVVHEFAHVGYDMMSANDKLLFNQMALASETEFVCSLLRANYPMFKNMEDSQILQLITKKDNATLVAANEVGAIRQTIDIINGSADAEQRQVACEERYAWEFSTWYAAGYTKGIAPDNQMHSMLDKTMHSLGKALNLISTIAARLQSPNWQAIQSDRSMVTMFENMNTRTFDTGGRQNVRRMYGGLRTQGEQQEQVQEGQQMPSTEEQIESSDSMQPSLFSPEYMYPSQEGTPTYMQGELFDNNSGNTQNVVTTARNIQRMEQDLQAQSERMQPTYMKKLNEMVNKNRNVTREEVDMVMGLSDDNYQKYANKVLAAKNPNKERIELLSYVDGSRGGMFTQRILEKINDRSLDEVLFPNARSKNAKAKAGQVRSNRVSNNSVIDSLEDTIGKLDSSEEGYVNRVINKLIEQDEKGEKSLQGYINRNKENFETDPVYKEALKRFNKKREKYREIRQKENERFAEYDRQKEQEKLQEYLSQNEEGIQDKYKKLMDRYESSGLDAVKKTMSSAAVRKDPRLWNEAYRRLETDVKDREEQRKAEEAKAFEQDVQKVVDYLVGKQKEGAKKLKDAIGAPTNRKRFKENPVYIEAMKRFNEMNSQSSEQQPQQNPQPVAQQPQPVEQKQTQPAKQVQENNTQTVQKQNATPVVESNKEEVAQQPQAKQAKEETTNGKTEDSGRVGDLPLSQGTLQEGGSDRTSASKQSVLQPRQRTELEGTEAGHGESVPLLKDKNGKLIGRQIPKVNDKRASADTKKILNAAYGKEQPLELEGFVNIDNSTNQQGDKGVQIYNKLFGTKHPEGTSVYIHRSGKAGFAVDKDGLTTIAIKKGEKGLLGNVLTIARVTDGVNNVVSEGMTQAEMDIYETAGFDAIGCIRGNDKDVIIFRKNNKSADEIIKGFDNKDVQKRDIEDLPTFQNVQAFKNFKKVENKSAKRKGMVQQISQEKKLEIETRLGKATTLFPSASDEDLQGVIDYVDGVLEQNKKATAKMGTERIYFLDGLKGSAQDELNNRKSGVELDEEGMVAVGNENVFDESNTYLPEIADPVYLYEMRNERLRNGEKDTTTTEEILEIAGEKLEEVQPIDVEESIVAIEKAIEQQELENEAEEGGTDTNREVNNLIKTLRKDVQAYNGEKKTTENKETILERIKSKFKEISELLHNKAEEEDDEASSEAVESSPVKVSTVKPVNSKLKLSDYNYDNTHKIVTGDILVNGVKHKGLTSAENTTYTEAMELLNEIINKYSAPNQSVSEVNRDISEEDKVRIGKMYRKLTRVNNLMHERFVKGLYGTKNTKDNPNLVYGHAVSYYRNPQWNFRRSLLGRFKRIMDANLIYDYQYGFDEVDQKKKLTDADAKKVRASITNIFAKIDSLKQERQSLRSKSDKESKKRKRTIRKQIKSLVNELYEQQVRLWSHGLDYNGNGKFQDEHLAWGDTPVVEGIT